MKHYKTNKNLHLRSTFSFTAPPKSASEKDTRGSTIHFKNSKDLLHLRSTFLFTGPPESKSEEDTHGSNTTYLKNIENNEKRSSHCV